MANPNDPNGTAKQIDDAFKALGSGVGDAAKQMVDRYAQRIANGENVSTVLQGFNPTGATYQAVMARAQAMKGGAPELRHSPTLDDIFGKTSQSISKLNDAANKVPPGSSPLTAQVAASTSAASQAANAFGAVTTAPVAALGGMGAGGSSPLPPPSGGSTSGSSPPGGSIIPVLVTNWPPNLGYVGTTTGAGGSNPTTTPPSGGGQNQQPNNKPKQPGYAEQAGKKAGGSIGAVLGERAGQAIGAYFGGPAGAAAGGVIGEKLGQKVGENVGGGAGAMVDRAKDVALSPDKQDAAIKLMPEAVQSIVKFHREMDKATETMIRHNVTLGEFSAAMQNVAGERDMQNAMRSKEIGDKLAPSAQYLMESEQYRRENSKELTILSQTISNSMQGFTNRLAGFLELPFEMIAAWINKQMGADGNDENAMTPWEYMQSISAESAKKYQEADRRLGRLADEQRSQNRGRTMIN